MFCPVGAFVAPLPAPPDALRRVAANDRAFFAPRACTRSRKSPRHRSRTNAVSKFTSRDAMKAHPPLEQEELTCGSLKVFCARISPTPLSLQFLSEILDPPGP